jgi:hypothetical protein
MCVSTAPFESVRRVSITTAKLTVEKETHHLPPSDYTSGPLFNMKRAAKERGPSSESRCGELVSSNEAAQERRLNLLPPSSSSSS